MHMNVLIFYAWSFVVLYPFGSSLYLNLLVEVAQRKQDIVLSFLYGSGALVRSLIRTREEANQLV